jgi:hypothetical protein
MQNPYGSIFAAKTSQPPTTGIITVDLPQFNCIHAPHTPRVAVEPPRFKIQQVDGEIYLAPGLRVAILRGLALVELLGRGLCCRCSAVSAHCHL